MKTLIVGTGGREAALAWKMAEHSRLHAFMAHENPSLIAFAQSSGGQWRVGNPLNGSEVAAFALENNIDLAFVSSDASLEAGVVDALKAAGIKTAGPTRAGAQIEWDKSFSRALTAEVCPLYNPEFYTATSRTEADEIVRRFEGRDFAVKPSGLTGGKGVKIVGIHLTPQTARDYAHELFAGGHHAVIFEERIDGVEFTLQAITDGKEIVFPPATYDYPYRYEGDQGPGTGGMGCYSDAAPYLPFMTQKALEEAKVVIRQVIDALNRQGRGFNGVLNSGFFLTRQGQVKIIEFNARFGDPECINIMALLDDRCNWVKVLECIADQKLTAADVVFKNEASALVYLVAPEYATTTPPPVEGYRFQVDINAITAKGAHVFFAAAAADGERYRTVGISRSVAIVATAPDIERARQNVMQAIDDGITGPLAYRRDIAAVTYIEDTRKKVRG